MSHFSVLVCITEKEFSGGHGIASAIAQRLAPYDENWNSPSYLVECSCNRYAHDALVSEALKAKLNYNYGDLRNSFSDIEKQAIADYFSALKQDVPYNLHSLLFDGEEIYEPLNDILQAAWDAHRSEYETTQKEFEQSIPKPAPNSDCEDCHGTGLSESTYNYLSEWDWYVVGGRWDGHLTECVEGLTVLGFQNSALARELAGKYAPFAIVDCDGFWHEKGDMGWWGMTSNEKPKDVWNKEAEAILNKQPKGAVAILVDCHI